eukprot:540921-Rhodomonas_salina.2
MSKALLADWTSLKPVTYTSLLQTTLLAPCEADASEPTSLPRAHASSCSSEDNGCLQEGEH